MATRNYNPFSIHKEKIPWRDRKFAYDGSNNLIYYAFSLTPSASTSEGSLWWIYKCTYDVNNNITDIDGPTPGNWDDRAALSY